MGGAPPEPEPLDLDVLASRLLTGAPAPAPSPGASEAERVVAGSTRHLPPPQVRLLSHAVAQRSTVEVECVTATGTRSTRVISELALVGTSLHCWCHSAQAPRAFRLDRVRAVRPAAG